MVDDSGLDAPQTYPFLKGHGTENDFVLLLDAEGTIHADLSADRVRALCDRRAGIGGDGVLRVIHTAVIAPELAERAEWFMDYRNADGSVAQMCGNGLRVFARYLLEAGRVDPDRPIPVATRDGIKVVTRDGDDLVADMGTPAMVAGSTVSANGFTWPTVGVDMGNPHAVAFVDDLAQAGSLIEAPTHDPAVYPDGVNVEFVVRKGDAHLAMRVYERGSGETRSCGTGACAVMVAAATADGRGPGSVYLVDVPGGRLRLTWREDGHVLLAGPAVLVGSGVTGL